MTTKEHKEMARRLAVRGIEAYKKRMILEEDLLSVDHIVATSLKTK